jgi:hypothetical protein
VCRSRSSDGRSSPQALGGKVFAIGGFNEQSQVAHGLSIYDIASGTWSDGPELPGGALNGFGPAVDLHVNRISRTLGAG